MGVSPNLKFPQEWGIQGVEKRLIKPLDTPLYITYELTI